MGIIKLEMFKSKEIRVALDIFHVCVGASLSPNILAFVTPNGINDNKFSFINIYLWKQDISIEDSDRERGA
jgi:hypothetical protein